tara:strand:+ start:2170 stop:2385 length:216 start_codon:yes stop_codon:yes gene_type:complete
MPDPDASGNHERIIIMTYRNGLMSATQLEELMARGRRERSEAFRTFFSGLFSRIGGLFHQDRAPGGKLGAA